MYKKVFSVAIAVISMFLFVGTVSAVCLNCMEVLQPNGGESLNAGEVYQIIVNIHNPKLARPAAKIRYDYSCDGGSWQHITTRNCNLYGKCPEMYPWEVPTGEVSGPSDTPENESDDYTCLVRVKLFDKYGVVLAKDLSDDYFEIDAYKGITPSP